MLMERAAPRGALRVRLEGLDALAREAVAARLVSAGDVEVASAGTSGAPAEDVVVWDLGPGDALPPEGTRGWPPSLQPPCVTLVPDASVGVDAVMAGARGVVFRDAPATALLAVVQAVSHGMAVMPPAVLESLVPEPNPVQDGDLSVEALTPREKEVLGLLVEGLSNRVIADRLGVSAHTAKFHVTSVMGKLGVGRRAEVVARAARMGFVRL